MPDNQLADMDQLELETTIGFAGKSKVPLCGLFFPENGFCFSMYVLIFVSMNMQGK